MIQKNSDRKEKIFILSILLLALILRLLALTRHDFWFDEAFTWEISKLPAKQLLGAFIFDNNPPFYYLIIHFILKINQSEVWIRLPSLIANIATIPAIYYFGKKFLTLKTGKIASILFALSPLSIYLTTEARPHSLAVPLLMFLVYAFFNLIEKLTLKKILGFLIISTLSLYTQYYFVLVLITFVGIVQFRKKLQRVKISVIVILPLLILLPWVLISKNVIHNVCWCPSTILSLPSSLVSPTVSGVSIVTLRSFIHLPFPYIILFSSSASISLIFFFKGLMKNKLLSAIYIIPLVSLSLAGLTLPVFSPKAFSIFIPLFFLLSAQSLVKAPRLVVPILIVMLGTTSVIQIVDPFFNGERIKNAYMLTKENLSAPIYHTSLATYYSFDYYSQKDFVYSQKSFAYSQEISAHTKGLQKNILLTPNPLSSSTTDYIGGKTQKVDNNLQYFWLVDIDKWTSIKDRLNALKEISSNYKIIETINSDEITVYQLEKR